MTRLSWALSGDAEEGEGREGARRTSQKAKGTKRVGNQMAGLYRGEEPSGLGLRVQSRGYR